MSATPGPDTDKNNVAAKIKRGRKSRREMAEADIGLNPVNLTWVQARLEKANVPPDIAAAYAAWVADVVRPELNNAVSDDRLRRVIADIALGRIQKPSGV